MRAQFWIVTWLLIAGSAQGADVLVTGEVHRAGGPAFRIEVDFVNLVTGDVLIDAAATDVAGQFSATVPEGIYEIRFSDSGFGGPPLLAPGRLFEVSVIAPGPVTLPAAMLLSGFHVTGCVENVTGTPVPGARVEFLNAGSIEPIFTTDDAADAAGCFDVIVPAGIYDVEIHAAAGLPLASARVEGVNVIAASDLGVLALPEGFAVTGSVVDLDAVPLREVRLFVEDAMTGAAVATVDDVTDAGGLFSIILSAGTYRIDFVPLINSLVNPDSASQVIVNGPTVRNAVLGFHNEDGDLYHDVADLCPFRSSLFQEDFDGDGFGGLCDNCPLFANPRQENNDGVQGGDVCDPDDDNDGLADLADTDRDGDLVSNSQDNCPDAFNPGQQDRDGNLIGDACDPDDGEVEYLEARTKTGFKWRPESGVSGYRVYRQRIARLSSINYGRCSHDVDRDEIFMRDEEIPASGQGFAYIVTGVVAKGEGSLGSDSADEERPNLRPCRDAD